MKAKEQNIDASLIDEYEKELVSFGWTGCRACRLGRWLWHYVYQGINKNIFVLKYYPDSGNGL